jgi:hypothetical protein
VQVRDGSGRVGRVAPGGLPQLTSAPPRRPRPPRPHRPGPVATQLPCAKPDAGDPRSRRSPRDQHDVEPADAADCQGPLWSCADGHRPLWTADWICWTSARAMTSTAAATRPVLGIPRTIERQTLGSHSGAALSVPPLRSPAMPTAGRMVQPPRAHHPLREPGQPGPRGEQPVHLRRVPTQAARRALRTYQGGCAGQLSKSGLTDGQMRPEAHLPRSIA